LDQALLKKVLLPVGDYHKGEIRELANKYGIRIAKKPDSQEICFIPDNNYKEFLTTHAGAKQSPGPIVNTEGKVLGNHEGIFNYTIGQRKGLGLTVGERLFVVDINPETNTVVVGSNSDVFSNSFTVTDFNWILGKTPSQAFSAQAMIRYNAKPQPAQINVEGQDRVTIAFDQAQRAITPGQSAVIYQDDEVLGGGVILARSITNRT
jgi:tRNA-specific 2-thiouridylase